MLVQNKQIQHMQSLCSPQRRQRSWYGPRGAQGGCKLDRPPGAFLLWASLGTQPRTEKSPFLSPVNSAEQTVSREGGSPWENVLARPGGSCPARRQGSAGTGPAPPCTAIILVKVCILPAHKRQCTFWTTAVLERSPLWPVMIFHQLQLSGPQFHILEDGLVMSVHLLGREVGRDLWRYGLPYLTVRVFLKCLHLTSVPSTLTITALAKVTIEVHMALDLSVAVGTPCPCWLLATVFSWFASSLSGHCFWFFFEGFFPCSSL